VLNSAALHNHTSACPIDTCLRNHHLQPRETGTAAMHAPGQCSYATKQPQSQGGYSRHWPAGHGTQTESITTAHNKPPPCFCTVHDKHKHCPTCCCAVQQPTLPLPATLLLRSSNTSQHIQLVRAPARTQHTQLPNYPAHGAQRCLGQHTPQHAAHTVDTLLAPHWP
jgi:hypothetical protein